MLPPPLWPKYRPPTAWRWRPISTAASHVFNIAKYAEAAAAFTFVASSLPLPEVVNDEGVANSRQGRTQQRSLCR